MFRTHKILVLLFTLTCASNASAQTAETEELARQYVALPEVQQMTDAMFSAESLGAQFAAGLPPNVQITEEQLRAVGEIMSEAMQGLRPEMEAEMVAASARHFNADELTALIAFYQSEHGASVMLKMQPYFQDFMGTMTPRIMSTMQANMPAILEIMQGD